MGGSSHSGPRQPNLTGKSHVVQPGPSGHPGRFLTMEPGLLGQVRFQSTRPGTGGDPGDRDVINREHFPDCSLHTAKRSVVRRKEYKGLSCTEGRSFLPSDFFCPLLPHTHPSARGPQTSPG